MRVRGKRKGKRGPGIEERKVGERGGGGQPPLLTPSLSLPPPSPEGVQPSAAAPGLLVALKDLAGGVRAWLEGRSRDGQKMRGEENEDRGGGEGGGGGWGGGRAQGPASFCSLDSLSLSYFSPGLRPDASSRAPAVTTTAPTAIAQTGASTEPGLDAASARVVISCGGRAAGVGGAVRRGAGDRAAGRDACVREEGGEG